MKSKILIGLILVIALIAGACFIAYKKPWTNSQGNITTNDVIVRCDKDIESINAQVNSLNNSVTMLQEQKTSQNTKINELTAKLNELDVKADNYAEQQKAIQNEITTLQTTVNTLDTQIKTLQNQVTVLEGYASTIETLQAEVLLLKENQTATTENLTELQNRLSVIEYKLDELLSIENVDKHIQVFGRLNNKNEIYGSVEYIRIGKKCGYLTINTKMPINSDNSSFELLDLTLVENLLNVTFKHSHYYTGTWYCTKSDDLNSLYGYGTTCEMLSNGHLTIGRYHTTKGDYGAWQFSKFSDQSIRLYNVFVEEI